MNYVTYLFNSSSACSNPFSSVSVDFSSLLGVAETGGGARCGDSFCGTGVDTCDGNLPSEVEDVFGVRVLLTGVDDVSCNESG